MTRPWPVLALAILGVAAAAGTASAQTVVVRGAPAGSSVELTVNSTSIGKGTASAEGEVTLPMDLTAAVGRGETDATVSLDVCGESRRLVVVERGQPGLPPQPGCERADITGVYAIRRATTLVVNVGGANPTLMLLQRPLGSGLTSQWDASPSGLMVFGGGGIAKFNNAPVTYCGNVSNCSEGGYTPAFNVGADLWLFRFLGVEASYFQTAKTKITGTGSSYRFETEVDAKLFTIAGKVGAPLGPVRPYARIGANYHRALSTTTQTSDPVTVTVNGADLTLPGSEQTLGLETKGWGWMFGGGLEVWVSPWLGLYGEYGRVFLKGRDTNDEGEGLIDDRMPFALIGARVRIGG